MTIVLVVPNTHVRGLRDNALISRLTTDVLHGLRTHAHTGVVAGHRIQLAQTDPAEDDALADALERRKPNTAQVRRRGAWTEVTLMPGYKVSLYAKELFR